MVWQKYNNCEIQKLILLSAEFYFDTQNHLTDYSDNFPSRL